MRDWHAYVRERLSLPAIVPAREARIVREVASQLEDFYQDAVARGESEEGADAHARAQVTDWPRLAESISQADRAHLHSPAERWNTRLADRAAVRGGAGRLAADAARELRYAARQLGRQPGFSVLAVAILALGIGANAAIFSVVHAVLLRSLPYPRPDRLVAVWADDARAREPRSWFSAPAVRDFQEQAGSFQSLSGISPRWAFTLRGGDEPERIFGYYVSANFLDTLGVPPAQGRAFAAGDDRPGAAPVALISHGLWRRRFGGDPSVVGRPLDLDGVPVTIAGILPPDFRLIDRDGLATLAEVWLPLSLNPVGARGRAVRVFTLIGRLRDGVSVEQARSETAAIAERLAAAHPDTDAGLGITAVPLREDVVGETRPLLLAIAAAVGLVLLMACANVANLMLARATSRQRQLAIRAALGAARWRLAAGPLAEGAWLAAAGAAAGLVLASWTVDTLVAMAPAELPRKEAIALNPPVLLATLGIAALTAILFAVAPALQAARTDLTGGLKDGSRGTGARAARLRRGLVVGEMALALVVVTAAALLLHSFIRLQRVEPGFSPDAVAVFDLSSIGADAARRIAVMEDIYARLARLPGVLGAGETSRLPLAGSGGNPTSNLSIERRPVPVSQEPPIDFRRASRGYFEAMGIPLIAGRIFDERDTGDPAAVRVVLINGTAAARFFPGEDPIGQRIRLGGSDWYTIAGIVGDIRHTGLESLPRPEAYVHTLQGPLTNPQLVVRTAGDPREAIPAIRAVIRAVEPGIVVSRVSTLDAVRDESLAGPRFNTVLFGAFAVLALVLGIAGIYGVMSYTVSERTREMGVRMALGASERDLLRMVLREGLTLAGLGTIAGAAGAVAVGRLLRGQLFDISPYDPVAFGAAAAVLLTSALLACWIPARRATRADPLLALRAE